MSFWFAWDIDECLDTSVVRKYVNNFFILKFEMLMEEYSKIRPQPYAEKNWTVNERLL